MLLQQVVADVADRVNKAKVSKKLSEETLRLEPLGDEVLHYTLNSLVY